MKTFLVTSGARVWAIIPDVHSNDEYWVRASLGIVPNGASFWGISQRASARQPTRNSPSLCDEIALPSSYLFAPS